MAVRIALIFATLLLLVVVYIKFIQEGKQPPDPTMAYVYDTDPQNNEFIKGRLTRYQLKQLDTILMVEKKQCGLRLSNIDLNALTNRDQALIEAYNRWRKCKDMMRSHHRVIYPDERGAYLQGGSQK